MSSFHKTVDLNYSIRGTKIKNNLPLASSGIPSLDHIIGGGLPSGTIFALEEDVLGNYSRVLCKYFLAEGVVCKHDLFIANAEDRPQEIVKELPQQCAVPVEDEVNSIIVDIDKMKIAWRYEGLSQVESSFGINAKFGHHFDLSKYIDAEIINNININYWSSDIKEANSNGFRNVLYQNLLISLKEVLQKDLHKPVNKDKNMLRICIQSLGSPTWMAKDCDEDSEIKYYGQDLMQFMFSLRTLVRDTNAIVLVTIPSHLFDDTTLIKRVLYSVDNAVRIESFAGSSKETNPVFKDYHGLFYVTKLSAINSCVPFVPPSLDMAFKLRRKKFVIEKLHLPPELQETSEREQDDITAVPKTCGGFKKKDIDF